MTDNEVRALMAKVEKMLVSQAEIRGDIKAIIAENAEGKKDHDDFETRLRALERVRWLIAGASAVVGSALTAAVSQLIR